MRARTPAPPPELDVLIEAAAHGHGARRTRAAARLMTVLEAEPQRLAELFRHLPQSQWLRPRLVLGITGAPGTGKSTLVDATVAELRQRFPSRMVGVIAVDPSSPFTGGAVLGDRVRMMRHATDPLVFIRSLATRGHLGGLSLGVKAVLRVMALLGCDVVLIETVGVGQSEIEVARVADRVGVVLAPGAGDSVQMLKAGLMEVGDVFVVNKADTEGADALHRSLIQTLGVAAAAHGNGAGGPAGPRRGRPEVLLTSAGDGRGITGLVDWMMRQQLEPDGSRTVDSAEADVRDAVLEAARRRLDVKLAAEPELLAAVLGGAATVDELVDRLLAERLNP
jgi:LAO/AO transport system kinase